MSRYNKYFIFIPSYRSVWTFYIVEPVQQVLYILSVVPSSLDFLESAQHVLCNKCSLRLLLKGVLAKNERGYRRMAKNKRFWSLLIILPFVASIRRNLFFAVSLYPLSFFPNTPFNNQKVYMKYITTKKDFTKKLQIPCIM